MVSIRLRGAQRLQQHRTDTLTPDVPVCAAVESLAPPVGRERPRRGERLETGGRQQHVHPAGDRHGALARADRPHRPVHGH